MKKALLLIGLIFLLLIPMAAGGVTLAWDNDTITWSGATEVAFYVRTAQDGPYELYPDRFAAQGTSATLDESYFEPGKTYYISAVAVENGKLSEEESNQVVFTAEVKDPFQGVPVMEKKAPPGPPVSLVAQ